MDMMKVSSNLLFFEQTQKVQLAVFILIYHIIVLMQKMYDDGDDTMKKTIGEAMLKSKQKQDNPGLADDFSMDGQ